MSCDVRYRLSPCIILSPTHECADPAPDGWINRMSQKARKVKKSSRSQGNLDIICSFS